MANTELINTIILLVKDMLTYMLPIIAIMSAITFIMSFLVSITLGWGRKTFLD